jgi:hypothetical protein
MSNQEQAHGSGFVGKWVAVHKCRILTTKGPCEFSGCAYPERCSPRAHGHASFVSYCVCGRVRLANVGEDNTVERGPWIPRPEGVPKR